MLLVAWAYSFEDNFVTFKFLIFTASGAFLEAKEGTESAAAGPTIKAGNRGLMAHII
jgi:hypothetical protein